MLEQLGCGADLAVGGVVEGDVDNRRLDFFGDPVTRVRLAAADFPQAFKTVLFVTLLQSLERVAGVAEGAAGRADVAEVRAEF